METLKQYKNIVEQNETLLSICIYDKKFDDVIKFFESQLEKAKQITNPIKKHKINNRLYKFIEHLNVNYTENDIINSIFFVYDNITFYKLTINDIKCAREYNFINIYYKTDTNLHIDYFIDIFNNFEFIYNIKINKTDMFIIKNNKNKEKEEIIEKNTNENKIMEKIEILRKSYKDIIIIHGNSPIITKLEKLITKNDIILVKDFLSKEDVYELYEKEQMIKNHVLLEKRMNDLQNEKCNIDLYVFGKLKIEIKDAIESYMLKELYIEDKKLDKLKTFVDESFFNFKIIIIKVIENGDIGEQFIKNYNGLMGIKYY